MMFDRYVRPTIISKESTYYTGALVIKTKAILLCRCLLYFAQQYIKGQLIFRYISWVSLMLYGDVKH